MNIITAIKRLSSGAARRAAHSMPWMFPHRIFYSNHYRRSPGRTCGRARRGFGKRKERRDTFVETERNQTACRIDAGAACRTAGCTADHAVQVGMRIEPQLRYDPQDRCRAALHDRLAARCRKGGRMIFSYSEAILIALLIWCSGFCAGTGFMRRDIEREDE